MTVDEAKKLIKKCRITHVGIINGNNEVADSVAELTDKEFVKKFVTLTNATKIYGDAKGTPVEDETPETPIIPEEGDDEKPTEEPTTDPEPTKDPEPEVKEEVEEEETEEEVEEEK